MPLIKRHARTLAVAVGCLGVGAGASAIASAGASSTSSSHSATPAAKLAAHRGLRGAMRQAVEGSFVVHTKTGFVTVRFERGFVQSVSGDKLTLREATKKATYRTVTVTVPASARVRNDRRASTLSSLTTGERVAVLQGPARTWVVARSAK